MKNLVKNYWSNLDLSPYTIKTNLEYINIYMNKLVPFSSQSYFKPLFYGNNYCYRDAISLKHKLRNCKFLI